MKLSDKLEKCGDSLTVNIFDNGYMVEVSGRNADGEWSSAKIMCSTLEKVNEIVAEAASMPRD